MRGKGKGEYIYVSGNTSEHGGEDESEGIVLPLEIHSTNKTKKIQFFFSLLVLNFRGYIKIKDNPPKSLPFNERTELMRKNVRITKKRKVKGRKSK